MFTTTVYINTSTPKSQKVCMSTFGGLGGQIFVVEVQYKFLGFEAELLIEQHGGITGRHMQRYVLTHARLKRNIHMHNKQYLSPF